MQEHEEVMYTRPSCPSCHLRAFVKSRCATTLAAEEIPDADLHFAAGKIPDRLTELWTADRVDVRDVVTVEDVEHFDEHRHRVPADDDLLFSSEVEIGVGLDAERVAWLRQVALIDEPIPV